jgi:hypothetical protein
MVASVTIQDWSMNPEEYNMFGEGSTIGSTTVAARLTGLVLNEVARSYTHNFCVIFLVMLTVILDIVLVGFWRYHSISLL